MSRIEGLHGAGPANYKPTPGVQEINNALRAGLVTDISGAKMSEIEQYANIQLKLSPKDQGISMELTTKMEKMAPRALNTAQNAFRQLADITKYTKKLI